jgi:hypothetical protein
MSCCGTTVYNRTVGMVRGARVPSNGGVVVIGAVRFITLHCRRMGKPEFPLPLEIVSSLSVDSLRMVCSDSDPL